MGDLEPGLEDPGTVLEEVGAELLRDERPVDDFPAEKLAVAAVSDDAGTEDNSLEELLLVDAACQEVLSLDFGPDDGVVFEEPADNKLLLDAYPEDEDVAVGDVGLLDWHPVDEIFTDVDTVDMDSADETSLDDSLAEELLGLIPVDELFEDKALPDDEGAEDDGKLVSFDVLIAVESIADVGPVDGDFFVEKLPDD